MSVTRRTLPPPADADRRTAIRWTSRSSNRLGFPASFSVGVLLDLHPLLLGMDWMDPNWLLDRFGSELFWLSLVIIFIECGLFFPFLPGDTLLFAMGLFITAERIDVFPAVRPASC